jgi:hypothetical protein
MDYSAFDKHMLTDWAEELSKQLNRPAKQIRDEGLMVGDFPLGESLRIQLDDRSYAQFNYAIFFVNPTKHEIAIFTEHSGYHIFPSFFSVIWRILRRRKRVKAWECPMRMQFIKSSRKKR